MDSSSGFKMDQKLKTASQTNYKGSERLFAKPVGDLKMTPPIAIFGQRPGRVQDAQKQQKEQFKTENSNSFFYDYFIMVSYSVAENIKPQRTE